MIHAHEMIVPISDENDVLLIYRKSANAIYICTALLWKFKLFPYTAVTLINIG